MKKYICVIMSVLLILGMANVSIARKSDIYEEGLAYAEGIFLKDGAAISQIEPGEIEFVCPVINRDDRETQASVMLCLFRDNSLESVMSSSVQLDSGGEGILSAKAEVPDGSGYELKAYVTEGLNVPYPLRKAFVLANESSSAKIEELYINGTKAEINEITGRIDAVLPAGSRLDLCSVETRLSEGAELKDEVSDFSQPTVLEVAAPNGDIRAYTVYVTVEIPKSEPYAEDFETHETGVSPTGWSYSKNDGGIASVEYEDDSHQNKLLKLSDTNAAGYINMYCTFDAVYAPCKISYRVKYVRTEEYSQQNDVSYSWVSFANASSLMGGMSAKDSASGQTLMYKSTSDREFRNHALSLGSWIDVSMIYGKNGKVDYYIDGDYVLTADAANVRDSVNRIYAQTTQARTSELYVDDIRVEQLDEPESTDFFEDFEEGFDFEVIIAGDDPVIENGMLDMSQKTVTFASPAETDCRELSFDFAASGRMELAFGENIIPIECGDFSEGRIAIHVGYDEDYRKNLLTVLYGDKVIKKSAAADDYKFETVAATSYGTMQIDNVYISE